ESAGVVADKRAGECKLLNPPVDRQELSPTVVKDILGYEFFTLEDGTPLELDPAYGEKFAQDYNRKVGVLAWHVAQLLKRLQTDSVASGKDAELQTAAKPTIYLAECSYDRKETREIIEGDLRRHGYTLLQDQQLLRE